MSKTKRLLAIVLAVLMTVSMLSVMTFAATPVFAKDYVDATGTIRKDALLVDPKLAGRSGEVSAQWDGVNYTFTMGENAFGTLAQAMSKADLNMGGDRAQILLAAGDYGNLQINMPIEIYGMGWNTDPNVKNASDPTADWTRNTKWNSNTSNVNAVVIQAGAYGGVTIQGVKIQGHIYDIQRAVSSVPFELKFKNIIYSQTSEGITLTQTNSATRVTNTNYAMSFRNYNANNAAETGKYNKDTTYLINFRVEKLENTRFIDEQVSPVFVFDGLYYDFLGLSDQGFWMKWMPYFDNCEFAIRNSYLKNISPKATAFYHEGFTNGVVGDASKKIPVGEMLKGQQAKLDLSNNVFRNVVEVKTVEATPTTEASTTTNRSIAIRLHSFTDVSVDGNYIINETPTEKSFISWGSTSDTTDYTDIVKITNNVFIGQTAIEWTYGTTQSKADFTGNYITPNYSTDWKSLTEGILPTGKIRYEYCYLDGARTRKTNEVPAFSIADAVVNDASKTVTMNAAAGTESVVPTVNGLPGYTIYESDADFTNLNDFKELTPVETLTLKNLTNNFLFVALSYDGNNQVPYKMTINKTASTTAVLNGLINVSTGANTTKNGLEFNVRVDRDYESVSFGLDLADGSTAQLYKEGETRHLSSDNGIYTLADLVLGETVVLRAEVSNGTDTEYYYLNVRRDLSDDTTIIDLDDNITRDGTKLSANAGEDDTEFSFDIEVAVGASVMAWRGTSVYTAKDGVLTIKDLRSGKNVFSLAVVAEDGFTTTTYELTITKPLSREAKLISITDADKNGDVFEATAVDSFVVNAKVSYGATYKVYSDEACTTEIGNNVKVTADTTVYVVVTAEDGVTKSAPYELFITKEVTETTTGSFTVEGGELVGGSFIDVEIANDKEEATLKIKADRVTYKLFADANCTVKATNKVKLETFSTSIYALVTFEDGTEVVYTITVYSYRTPAKYADANKIPAWAKPYVDALNEGGFGIIKGDENGNFNANNNTIRYEIAAIATRILGIDASQFASVKLTYADKIADWAENYVKAVTKLGIMGGTKDSKGKLVFDGKGNTTRAQLAKIIMEVVFNALGLDFAEAYPLMKGEIEAEYNKFKFADESKVQAWAKDYVKAAVAFGYFNGKENGGKNYIDPNTNIKRSELATVVARLFVAEE